MKDDHRIVMTLDAGGTNLVFSAICGGEEIVTPVHYPTASHDLEACLATLVKGFREVESQLSQKPVAISFAFPGPADYRAGIIGDLPNFPSFRGGVALGPFLEANFGIPVFINNDGALFAYGEALAGMLPEINNRLEKAGSTKRYQNLIGITLGTGFGGGVVINGELLYGDNQSGGSLWCLRNKKYPEYIVEESVSIRAVCRVYAQLSGDTTQLTPKDIFDIAEGKRHGDAQAAIKSFEELGEMAGDTIAAAITMIDGLVVIGGGVVGAAKYILPALMKELNAQTGMMDGRRFPRLQMKAFNLENSEELVGFLTDTSYSVKVPGTDLQVPYDPYPRMGVALSKLGASKAISLGAYWYALNHLK